MPARLSARLFICLFATTLAVGCGDTESQSSEPKAPPAGHCEALCNRLDAVNQALECDVDTVGLGETYVVDVAACTADCNEPSVCTDAIVAYDQCRIALMDDQFFCESRRSSPPLTSECTTEFDVAIDCQIDNR